MEKKTSNNSGRKDFGKYVARLFKKGFESYNHWNQKVEDLNGKLTGINLLEETAKNVGMMMAALESERKQETSGVGLVISAVWHRRVGFSALINQLHAFFQPLREEVEGRKNFLMKNVEASSKKGIEKTIESKKGIVGIEEESIGTCRNSKKKRGEALVLEMVKILALKSTGRWILSSAPDSAGDFREVDKLFNSLDPQVRENVEINMLRVDFRMKAELVNRKCGSLGNRGRTDKREEEKQREGKAGSSKKDTKKAQSEVDTEKRQEEAKGQEEAKEDLRSNLLQANLVVEEKNVQEKNGIDDVEALHKKNLAEDFESKLQIEKK